MFFKNKLYLIDDEYSEYLRKIEPKIPYTEYGYYSLKPFVKAFENNGFAYMVPITSFKPKFRVIQEKEQMQFIRNPFGEDYLGCLRFGKMFPVPLECLKEIDVNNLGNYRGFTSSLNELEFEHRLKLMNFKIDQFDLEYIGKQLYNQKMSDEYVAAFDYPMLEKMGMLFKEHLAEHSLKIDSEELILE